jgi:hypothetical protein
VPRWFCASTFPRCERPAQASAATKDMGAHLQPWQRTTTDHYATNAEVSHWSTLVCTVSSEFWRHFLLTEKQTDAPFGRRDSGEISCSSILISESAISFDRLRSWLRPTSKSTTLATMLAVHKIRYTRSQPLDYLPARHHRGVVAARQLQKSLTLQH